MLCSVTVALNLIKSFGETFVCLERIGLDRDCRFKTRDSLLVSSQYCQRGSEINARFGVTRVDGERLLKIRDGLFHATKCLQ